MPVTSPASMGKIKTEFGGGAGAKLTDYYKGGAKVPNTITNNNVPTSGQIKVSQFVGASVVSGGTVSITNQTIDSIRLSPLDCTVLYEINPNGVIYRAINNGTQQTVETWLTSGTNTEFQCRATLVSGAVTTSTGFGTWAAMNGGQSWSLQRTSNVTGNNQAVITIEIRRASDSVVLDTATITLYVEVYV